MYELRHISTTCRAQGCPAATFKLGGRRRFGISPQMTTATNATANTYSIYAFRRVPKSLHAAWKALPAHGHRCDANLYPLVYWLVMALAIYALYSTVREFLGVLRGKQQPTLPLGATCHPVQLNPSIRRWARVGSSLLMAMLLLAFLVGIATHQAGMMQPWLLVRLSTLAGEFFFWLVDLWDCGSRTFSVRTLVTFALAYVYWLSAWTLAQTFEDVAAGVAMGGEDVSLLGSLGWFRGRV